MASSEGQLGRATGFVNLADAIAVGGHLAAVRALAGHRHTQRKRSELWSERVRKGLFHHGYSLELD